MGIHDITKGSDIIHGYCFRVEFNFDDKYMEIGFAKISSVENSVEYETITEGSGEIHIVPKYMSQPKTVTFSKGVISSTTMVLPNLLAVGKNIKEIAITIGDNQKSYDSCYRKYLLKDCVVTKCSISDIDAGKSDVLIETFEISYLNKVEITGASNSNYK